jgi:predicted RNA binding protein YcfA (HicA-like mRNA interferase family)
MDLKNMNWKLIAAVLAALGYVAYRNKGFSHLQSAATKHGTIAAVVAVVTYLGYDTVMSMVNKQANVGGYVVDDLPSAAQMGLDDYSPRQRQVPPTPTQLAGYSKAQHQVGLAGNGGGRSEQGWPYVSMGC